MADGIDNCAEGPVDVTIEYPTEIIPKEKEGVCYNHWRKSRNVAYARVTNDINWIESRLETIKQMTSEDSDVEDDVFEDNVFEDNVDEDADYVEEEGVEEDEEEIEEDEEEDEEHVEESRSTEKQ